MTGIMQAYFTFSPGSGSGSLGTLVAFGGNTIRQLGAGSTASSVLSPVNVLGLGSAWSKVSAGDNHGIGIKSDGTLWSWGSNISGQIGNNTTNTASSPTQEITGGTTWSQADGGQAHTAAVKTDGSLWLWGLNNHGQLANGGTTTSPTGVSSPATTVNGGTTWKQVSCGRFHTMAIKTDGTLWGCGYNSLGQIGNGSTAAAVVSFVTVSGGGTNWSQVSSNYDRNAAIKTDGTLWVWGSPNVAGLGTGTTSNYSSPRTTINGGTTWTQVACGVDFTAAIKTDGTLWTCGANNRGQLGTGNNTSTLSFVTVAGGGTTWSSVACGSYNQASIKTDGSLWVCGYNLFGQLGTGSTTSETSLVTNLATGTWSQACGGIGTTYVLR